MFPGAVSLPGKKRRQVVVQRELSAAAPAVMLRTASRSVSGTPLSRSMTITLRARDRRVAPIKRVQGRQHRERGGRAGEGEHQQNPWRPMPSMARKAARCSGEHEWPGAMHGCQKLVLEQS